MTEHRKPIAFGYARKSLTREAVEDDKFSPERQRLTVEAWCQANGYQLVDLFEDAEGYRTGRNADRPGWRALLKRLETETPAAVVCELVDRAGREMALLVNFAKECERRGIRLIFVQDNIDFLNPDDRLKFYIKAMLAEEESERISRKMKLHIKMRREKHGAYWGVPPFGTCRDKTGKLAPDPGGVWFHPGDGNGTGPRWSVEPQEEPWVRRGYHAALRRLYELYASGAYGFSSLADQLNAEGWRYKSRDGTPRRFRTHDVRRAIYNWRYYAGDLTAGETEATGATTLVPGAWEPILPLTTIERVARLLDRRGAPYRGRPQAPVAVYELSGLLHCARCGKRLMAATTRHGTRKYRHHYKGECPAERGALDASETEGSARDLLSLFSLPRELDPVLRYAAHHATAGARDPETEPAAKLALLRRRRSRLLELYLDDESDDERSKAEYRRRLRMLDGEIREQEIRVETEAPGQARFEQIVARLRYLDETMQRVSPKARKALLAEFFTRLDVDPDTGKLYYTPAEWARPFF